VGTPDANGFAPLSASFVRFKPRGLPAPPEDSDIEVRLAVNDVHCQTANAACPGGAGSDYVGPVLVRATMQVTDRLSGPAMNESATVESFELDVPVDCVAISTNEGSRCNVTTMLEAFYPGAVLDSKRAIWQSGAATIMDPGPNGTGFGAGCPATCGDGDESVFLRQGIFIP